jgi:hypothetical protein
MKLISRLRCSLLALSTGFFLPGSPLMAAPATPVSPLHRARSTSVDTRPLSPEMRGMTIVSPLMCANWQLCRRAFPARR